MKKIAFLLFLCLFIAPLTWAVPSVDKVRIGEHSSKTRLVLEVSQLVKPKVFTLPNPARVVIDFPQIDFNTSVSRVQLPSEGVISKMRQGQFKPKVVRMVLDLKHAVTPTVFTIPASGKYKNRIVIDLRPVQNISKKSIPKLSALSQTQEHLAPVVRPKRVKKPQEPVVVVIDPGHGGVDPGAIGRHKTFEKNVVLSMGKALKAALEKNRHVKVYLTRSTDTYIKLNDRVKFAQRRDADLFISLHADAHRVRKVRGGSVYVLSEKSSDKEAARLAREANEGDLFAGLDISKESKEVQNILIDLTQRETMNRSSLLAQGVLKEMGKVTRLRKDKVMFAGFRVLKAPEIPSILVELAYLSNPTEEKNLRSSHYRSKVAAALAKGIEHYIHKHLPSAEK